MYWITVEYPKELLGAKEAERAARNLAKRGRRTLGDICWKDDNTVHFRPVRMGDVRKILKEDEPEYRFIVNNV